MNVLPREKQVQVISALVEGCSIRSIERMYDVHRDTVTRLMVHTGQHCMTIMDDVVRDVPAGTIQCDEIWCYVRKKDTKLNLDEKHNPEIGSQFIFVAMDADTKLVPCYRIGKRIPELAFGLMADLRERVVGHPHICTDGFLPYLDAVATAFNGGADYAMLVKTVRESRKPVREGYAPGKVVTCKPYPIFGNPDPIRISTSLIERQNLTMRMSMRRLTRLTNAFSKKLDNLKAAVALHYAHYNFCRVHKTLRVTPAMAAGLSAVIWDSSALLPE
jgi:IS1 family transposase